MSVVKTHDAVAMALTDSAAKKVSTLIAEECNPELKLRVFVTGGGCSGFQYGFSFDEAVNDDDTVITHNGAKLLVDPLSFQYLVGSQIDYYYVVNIMEWHMSRRPTVVGKQRSPRRIALLEL